MVPQSNGKIFLTEERGIVEKGWFRSYNTFNFGSYRNEHKQPFGALAVLNEDTLAGGKSMAVHVAQDADIILIPTVGDIEFSNSNGDVSIVNIVNHTINYFR